MKNIIKLAILIFVLNFQSLLYAEVPHYLDFKYILNQSDAGKKAQQTLKSKLDNGIKKLKTKEKNLQEEEKKIVAQKKIISAEEAENFPAFHISFIDDIVMTILTNSQDANDLGAPLFYASAYYFDDLLERGAEIYLWDLEKKTSPIARTMHSKTLVVDSCVFAAGSFNLDGRAYNWENEYFFPVFDEQFAAVGQNMFDGDLNVNGVHQISTEWMDETFSWYDRLMMQALALGSSLL